METGLRAAEKLQSILDGRDWGTEVLELKVQLDHTRGGAFCCPAVDVGRRSSRSWRSWRSIRRRSTSARSPSMALTTNLTTRPSSSTRTTSFDLRSARRHRGR